MSGVKNRSASCPKLLKFQQSLPDINLLSTSSVMLLLRNLPFDLQSSNITSLLYTYSHISVKTPNSSFRDFQTTAIDFTVLVSAE